jgi:hypothetical protein
VLFVCESLEVIPPRKPPTRVCVFATPGPSRRSIDCDPSVFPPSTPAGRLNAILTFISISPLVESLGGDGPGGTGDADFTCDVTPPRSGVVMWRVVVVWGVARQWGWVTFEGARVLLANETRT